MDNARRRVPNHYRLDIGGVADTGNDEVTFGRQSGQVGGGARAGGHKLVHAAGGTVPDGQVKTGLDEIEGHAAAHDAEADKANTFTHTTTPEG